MTSDINTLKTTAMQPLCFVLMPFGKKKAGDRTIDFDAVYAQIIHPAVCVAGLEPLRADEEQAGGFIHKAMFERLILCPYAVADLTTANANVFYELGIRHAVRQAATALIFADGLGQLPFDVNGLRGLPYQLGPDGKPSNAAADSEAIAARLRAAKEEKTDSPIFQLVDGYPEAIQHEKTDVFRDRVRYAYDLKRELAAIRQKARTDQTGALTELRSFQARLGDLGDAEAGVLVDLLLSYRALSAWPDMIGLAEKLPAALARTVMVREQHALGLNRAGRGEEAESMLLDLLVERGPSSETYGILGRVYKDRWQFAEKNGQAALAGGLLSKAIDAYVKGFQADWRDAYPGINALTLIDIKNSGDPRFAELLPVVRYAVERKIAAGQPDYWDYATRLELAVLARDEEKAMAALGDALGALREPWEAKTTRDNLTLIREGRAKRGEVIAWADAIEQELTSHLK